MWRYPKLWVTPVIIQVMKDHFSIETLQVTDWVAPFWDTSMCLPTMVNL